VRPLLPCNLETNYNVNFNNWYTATPRTAHPSWQK
jgi:hypothetical protein